MGTLLLLLGSHKCPLEPSGDLAENIVDVLTVAGQRRIFTGFPRMTQ